MLIIIGIYEFIKKKKAPTELPCNDFFTLYEWIYTIYIIYVIVVIYGLVIAQEAMFERL